MTDQRHHFHLDESTPTGQLWLKILEATSDGEWHRWDDLVTSLTGDHPAKTASNRIADAVKAGHLERRGGPRRQASVRRRIIR